MSRVNDLRLQQLIRKSARMYFAPVIAAVDIINGKSNDQYEKVQSQINVAVLGQNNTICSSTTKYKDFNRGVWPVSTTSSTVLTNPVELNLNKAIHQR